MAGHPTAVGSCHFPAVVEIMKNWSPQDLPFQRDKAVTILEESLALWGRADSLNAEKRQVTTDALARLIRTYRHADLMWLDGDVCQIIADTMGEVPEWSPSAAIPTYCGLIAFEGSPVRMTWTGAVDEAWREVSVDALAWETRDGWVTIRALSRLEGARDQLSMVRTGIPFDEIMAMTVPLEATLGAGAEMQKIKSPGYRGPASDAKAILALAGATWLLMSQPALIEDGEPTVARVKRRTTSGRKVVSPVKVSVKTLGARYAGGTGGAPRRKATSRWWVRGHWRQQPWGKGRKLRKPVFIAPHLAGNPEVEVDERPSVQVVRNGGG